MSFCSFHGNMLPKIFKCIVAEVMGAIPYGYASCITINEDRKKELLISIELLYVIIMMAN